MMYPTKSIHDKISYKRLSAIAKRERRERKRLSCEEFTSQTEYDLGKPRPNTYKILIHFNQDIREYGIINCRLNIDKFTFYFKTLRIDKN